MTSTEALPLNVLYEKDETAWLEIMSNLAAQERCAEIDYQNLSEFLADMAKRDRREVSSRLVVLLVHLLKWEYQPKNRSSSWLGTVVEQRRELRKLLESGTLYNHAIAVLAEAYADARRQAAAESGLPREMFPLECSWELESLLADEEDANL